MYIGLMSGTSIDAIDAALVSFNHENPVLIETSTTQIPHALKDNLTKLVQSTNCDIRLLGETDTELGHLFAKTCLNLLSKTNIPAKEIIAIGSHGQTIFHAPNNRFPFTLQIGDPNIIAAQTNITTVADFRRKDMALGGQAAPLVPAFHDYLFKNRTQNYTVVNIGGIANITNLPKDKANLVSGFDTGPGNTLLDQWHQHNHGIPIDFNGNWAASGKINQTLLNHLLAEPYFKLQPPKSTGREYFNIQWLKNNLSTEIPAEDIQTTLTELTAITITNAIKWKTTNDVIWVCGGGAFNQYLMQRIRALCAPATVKLTTDIGVNPQWIEAMAFAWLAKQTIEKKPGNLPCVTGARKKSILGAIYYA